MAKHIVEYIESHGRKDETDGGVDFTVTGSYLEIYNEQLKDLVAPLSSKEKLDIRFDPRSASGKELYVQGLQMAPLFVESDYVKLIKNAVDRRHTSETEMNAGTILLIQSVFSLPFRIHSDHHPKEQIT